MPDRRDQNLGLVNDFEQCDIARAAERYDEFAEKRTLADFAAGKGGSLQRRDAGTNGDKPLLRQFNRAGCATEFPFNDEIE